ncbi:MAG TPA: methylmalonyl Co-A mutase-associated GTPase MeaB [Ilumatobacteraceae bacterium]|nr:methylmalonyl Co-A mutase-associated GTPase MeaB [Ilumatobacteraceae bacterium]HRB01965.1 methylmalonyl Co-A mutase-associated GTPase MeaB [Ilumatobacteraceae bacterium]
MDVEALLSDAVGGDRRSLSRLLSVVELDDAEFRAIAPAIFAARRGSYSVGLTGAPGAGKSTLTDALVAEIRRRGERVAVLAVDPSSPITGGAILGDRVRFRESHALDDDVFVRSLASRGHLGGLSLAVPAALRTLDAAGWPTVLLETVGVGQSEVAIADAADTTLVVVNPGWGDEVQANKAGLLEVADILVVNKGDRPGAESTVRDLERMLHLGADRPWRPPVLTAVAIDGSGVDVLWDNIVRHQTFLAESGEGERRHALQRVAEARGRALADIQQAAVTAEASVGGAELLDALRRATVDPVTAGQELLRRAVEAATARLG